MIEPKVFVGTMKCGEGDFDECAKAIASQVGVEVRHVVIADKPEREAHNALWSAWRAERENFHFFVKVDADTVLANERILSNFWEVLSGNPRVTGIQAPLLDYFTDGHINGLNCFGPKVTFRDSSHELFCDRQVDVDHDIIIGSGEVPESLRPAGFHCYHTNDRQAFHYGLHRALKNQTRTIELVRNAWKKYNDRPRALALIGAEYAHMFKAGGFNYSDERFSVAFEAVTHNFDRIVKTL